MLYFTCCASVPQWQPSNEPKWYWTGCSALSHTYHSWPTLGCNAQMIFSDSSAGVRTRLWMPTCPCTHVLLSQSPIACPGITADNALHSEQGLLHSTMIFHNIKGRSASAAVDLRWCRNRVPQTSLESRDKWKCKRRGTAHILWWRWQ